MRFDCKAALQHRVLSPPLLEYLEESNKIAVTMNGITWIHNSNPDLRKAFSKGLRL